MRLTKVMALVLSVLPVALHAEKAGPEMKELDWDMNFKAGIYTHKSTGVTFNQFMGGFKGHDAYPISKDGIARFDYFGERGMIDIYLTHRAAVNLPRQGDYATPFFKRYRPLLLKDAGKVESETSSDLLYQAHGRRGKGHRINLHLVSSPKFDGKSVYDEFGVVQIGEFLLYYRGTFTSKEGFDDLAKFLRALGITTI
jgi:hypothetical protein